MKKFIILGFLFLFLVACGAVATPETTDEEATSLETAVDESTTNEDEAESTEDTMPANSSTEAEETTEIDEPEEDMSETEDDAGSTEAVDGVPPVVPATTVVDAAVVRSQDWVQGPEDAAVTIIEYGDFQ